MKHTNERKVLSEAASRLEHEPPRTILRWAIERYESEIALSSGFGMQSVLAIFLIHDMDLLDKVEVFYLDTDLLFPETLETCRQLEAKYGFQAVPLRPELTLDEQAEEYELELWKSDPTACCRVRKVNPLRKYLRTKKAWITGLRRSQSKTRANIPVTMWDDLNQLAKINPMACMSDEEITGYIASGDVPYNPLFDRGFTSIGCMPCTRPVTDGEDARAGRWSGQGKTECGIHVDGKTIRDDNAPRHSD